MERVNKLIKSPLYKSYLAKNAEAERERLFCRHDFGHALDVARVAYIMALEENLGYNKEVIYAAALLHDIGRWKEYMDGSDHAAESALLAEPILKDCEFNEVETIEILKAIRKHRDEKSTRPSLGGILYKSDKQCRNCWNCNAISNCKRFANGETPVLSY